MSEAPIDMGMVSAPSAAAAPAAPPAPVPAAARPTPGTAEWAALSQEQRHAALRGPENPRSRGHSPARDTYEQIRAAQDQPTPDPAPAPSGEAPPAEGDLAATKFKVGKFEVDEGTLGKMLERQALDDLKRATLPADPSGYRAELPPDLKLPGGIDYKFDQANPSLAVARNWAHAKGLSQAEFSEVLAIYASHEAGQEAALAERSRAEIAKAGVNAGQRVDAVGKWITGLVGEADAAPIRATIVTDAHLRFFERMMSKISSQGSASFSQQHRIPPADSNSIPGYENMSFEQKRFAQDQRAQRGR